VTAIAPTPASRTLPEPAREPEPRIEWRASTAFLVAHAIPLLAFVTGVSTRAAVLFAVLFFSRIFFVTGAYHRYFSHRSFRAGRVVQFLLAFGGTTAAQKGPLWWAAHHRRHHRESDTDGDVHSPRRGFWWSHVGWILSDRWKETDLDLVPDLARYPELRFLNRFDWIGPWTVGIASFLIAGWSGLVFGFFGSTVLLWHSTFSINSLAHVWGTRRFATDDTSRNNLFLALLTGGEGWHNNHHHHPVSARQGFTWWEVDTTWYALRGLAALGLVQDLKRPTARALQTDRLAAGTFDRGMYRDRVDRAARIAAAAVPTTADAEIARARVTRCLDDARAAAVDYRRAERTATVSR
jgi:stearoyl-CoA desaturase (delta-9 desaturase)